MPDCAESWITVKRGKKKKHIPKPSFFAFPASPTFSFGVQIQLWTMFAYFVALVPPCWDVRGLGYECVFSHGYTSKWHFLFDDDGYRDQLLNGVYLNGGHGRSAMEPGMACYDSSSSCGLRSTKPWTILDILRMRKFYQENDEIKSLDQQAELLLTGGVVRVTVGGLFGGLAGQETLRMEIPPG